MKKTNLRTKAEKNKGEYVFGSEDTGSHAYYMIYGILIGGEKNRAIKPGKGHEEIFISLNGNIKVTGYYNGTLERGEVIHLEGEQTCFIENLSNSENVYIVSGGHSGHGH